MRNGVGFVHQLRRTIPWLSSNALKAANPTGTKCAQLSSDKKFHKTRCCLLTIVNKSHKYDIIIELGSRIPYIFNSTRYFSQYCRNGSNNTNSGGRSLFPSIIMSPQLIYWSLACRDYSRSKLCLLSYQLRWTTLIDSPISHLVFLFNSSILVSKKKSLLPSYCYSKALFCLFHYGWGRFPNYINGWAHQPRSPWLKVLSSPVSGVSSEWCIGFFGSPAWETGIYFRSFWSLF